ncbi:hypothetical protein TNCV_958461 [Trichonephila clavipes]|nr:hypothetical protein TNCV_958461 [Trichonephila clavipes]
MSDETTIYLILVEVAVHWREVHEFLKKWGSCPLDEDNLNELMTVYDNKELDTDEVEGEVRHITADLIRKGLKFDTSMERNFITHDPDIERALQFLRNFV